MDNVQKAARTLFPQVFEALEKTKQPTAAERIAALEAAVAEIALRDAAGEVQDDV